MQILNDYWRLFIVGFVFSLNPLSAKTQVTSEQIRNTVPIAYYLLNPQGNNSIYTWTINGGTIVGHSSPYTAVDADTIQVIWNDSNKTLANYGTLKVSKIVKWPSGSSCPSEEEQINIESWVQPKVTTNISEIKICSNESFIIRIYFEGKPEYKYKWKLYDKENPAIIIEDHTSKYIDCLNTSTDIVIAGIVNNSGTEKIVEFQITEVKDTFPDVMPANIESARVTVYVQPKTTAGSIKSNNQLIHK